jgi:hypothetical protein
MRRFTSRSVLFPAGLILLCTACEAAPSSAVGWGGTIDTLPNGSIMVVNPVSSGLWGEGEGWTVTEELRIGSLDGEGAEVFGEIADLEVDALDRIWVLERQARELRLYGPEGEHIRTVGREGSGPGEFNAPNGLVWSEDGTLWVVDPRNARFSFFDTTGAYLGSQPRGSRSFGLAWDGLLLPGRDVMETDFVFEDDRNFPVWVSYDSTGTAYDSIRAPAFEVETFVFRGDRFTAIMPVPFAPGLSLQLLPNRTVWRGMTDSYRFVQTTLAGDTILIFEQARRPQPVTSEDRKRVLRDLSERMGSTDFDVSRIPDDKPLFEYFFFDELDHMWVRVVPEDPAEDAHLFDVFDPLGRYLGQVRTPTRISLRDPVFREGKLYTVTTDDLEVQYVVRLRIERETGR